tara:strand:- start:65 stop:244 length:180 start_codon:yes stop_codon:yes gene_type:complete
MNTQKEELNFNLKVDNGVADDLATASEIEPRVIITLSNGSLQADGDVILDLKSYSHKEN